MVVEVAEALHWFSDQWIFWGHWPEVFGTAADSARLLGDPLVEATQLNYHAWAVVVCEGRPRDALPLCEAALAAAVRAGDPVQQAWAHTYRATAFRYLGEHDRAQGPLDRAVEIFAAVGDLPGLLSALHHRANNLKAAGRTDEAFAAYRESPGVAGRTRRPARTAHLRLRPPGPARGPGAVPPRPGAGEEAIRHHRIAVDISREGGNTASLSHHLAFLAEALSGAGRTARARDVLHRCLALGPEAAPTPSPPPARNSPASRHRTPGNHRPDARRLASDAWHPMPDARRLASDARRRTPDAPGSAPSPKSCMRA